MPQKSEYIPSPEEIAQKCADIRSSWTEWEFERRREGIPNNSSRQRYIRSIARGQNRETELVDSEEARVNLFIQ